VRGGGRFQSPPGKKEVILWQGSRTFPFFAMLLPKSPDVGTNDYQAEKAGLV
jgi:hypothetical protein